MFVEQGSDEIALGLDGFVQHVLELDGERWVWGVKQRVLSTVQSTVFLKVAGKRRTRPPQPRSSHPPQMKSCNRELFWLNLLS